MDNHDRDQPNYREHRHRHPGERVPGLQRPVLVDVAQKRGHKHDRSQVLELKREYG